jgi:hypothetical protein
MEHKMDCSTARYLIPQYLHGELDDDTRRQVEQHISGCPDCRTDLEQERSLGRVLGQSASDDPPEEYWGSYNQRVRSRLRGVFGMLWRLSWVPGCLAGAFSGLIFSGVFLWLILGHGLRSVHSVWMKDILVGLMLVATGVVVYLTGKALLMKANLRVLPRYERDETSLKRAIAVNPVHRRILIGLLMFGYVGISVFSTLLVTGVGGWCRWLTPTWTVNTLRVAMLIAFAAGIPAQYVMTCGYMDGYVHAVEWCQKHRKYLLLLRVWLILVGIAWSAAAVWQLTIIVR